MVDSTKGSDLSLKIDGLELRLRRYADDAGTGRESARRAGERFDATALLKRKELELEEYGRRTPVLLLHGASAGRQTFEFPPEQSFVDFLLRYTNLEPWLLDWRGSKNVTDRECDKPAVDVGNVFTFDHAAEEDVPTALQRIKKAYDDDARIPIRLVGHCMAAAVLSIAIARNFLADLRPSHIVLSTIGLYCEVAVDGRLKAEDRLLERLWSGVETKFIDPRCQSNGGTCAPRIPWPDEMNAMYEAWPNWFKPHRGRSNDDVEETCNRLSFMYGEPYYEPALDPRIHEDRDELHRQFGAIPLQMYLHAAQSVRRGWFAKFDADLEDVELVDGKQGRFEGIDVTLLTGAMNRLWHRDSIDRMHEWLKRGSVRSQKCIFTKYGHQDLFWGRDSWCEVFPLLAKRLTTPADKHS